ncbi:hypothetical protein EV121DRAFT_261901 [Schizophyllum commune]
MLPTHASETTPLYSSKLERPSSFNWLSAIKYLCFSVPAVILISTSWPRTTPVEPEFYWDVPLVPETDCLGYGTRAYSAKLNIVPSATKNWHKICMGEAPEVEVTGRILEKPAWCDMGINQTVVGHWIVDFDEPECISSWGQFDDKGCTTEASGFRTYEATLFGRLDAGAWRDMCRRTPAIVHGTKFTGAMRCYHEEGKRIYGAWDLEDETCA